MLHYETPLEREIALQSFLDGLGKANDLVAQAKTAYESAKERRDTLQGLINRIQADEWVQEFEQLTLTTEALDVAPSPPANNTPTKPVRRKGFRNDVFDIVEVNNVVHETKTIIDMVRKALGRPVAKSSIASALADLANEGRLRRIKHSNTSHYWLPEWFDGDEPKLEHAF